MASFGVKRPFHQDFCLSHKYTEHTHSAYDMSLWVLTQPHLAPGLPIVSSQSHQSSHQTDPTSSPRLYHPVPQTRLRSIPRTTYINNPEISPPADVTANSRPHQTPTHTGTPHPSVHFRTPICAPTSPITPAKAARIPRSHLVTPPETRSGRHPIHR
ncbi:hypothetical protein B9Z19DRAFT_1104924 [Tuber borchii]|uniref:Uncharacterized protein n=1 Tax=Tuber borchii TaxID=42251 RepID=A0A2T7A7V1_TUBBO|nr:hypothetical protein B9Z19DRAFT_1104924 [Tuber borchii]